MKPALVGAAAAGVATAVRDSICGDAEYREGACVNAISARFNWSRAIIVHVVARRAPPSEAGRVMHRDSASPQIPFVALSDTLALSQSMSSTVIPPHNNVHAHARSCVRLLLVVGWAVVACFNPCQRKTSMDHEHSGKQYASLHTGPRVSPASATSSSCCSRGSRDRGAHPCSARRCSRRTCRPPGCRTRSRSTGARPQ